MRRYATIADTVPEPCRVFGTVMRPFSLGHHLLFVRAGLPFANRPWAEASRDSILIGVAICGMRYAESVELFICGDWQQVFDQWLKDLKKAKPNWTDEETRFRSYLEAGYRKPPLWRHNSTVDGAHLSSEWELLLKCRLVAAGFSESEVLEGYLPARWYDYFTVMEIEQVKNCKQSKNWRRVFFTKEDAVRLG